MKNLLILTAILSIAVSCNSGGKKAAPLHGLPDVTEVLLGAFVQRPGTLFGFSGERLQVTHGLTLRTFRDGVK